MEIIMDNTNIDRRKASPSQLSLLNKLTIPQQFASSSLTNFGYDLTYVRDSNTNPTAIFLCGSQVAVIDVEGDINTNPNIIIR